MQNTLHYVCNTPVMCYIHKKILCDVRQQQDHCFFVHAGATIFFMRHFLMRGLGNIWDPSNFWHREGGECWFHWCHFSCCICINVTHVFFCLSAMYVTALHMSQFVCSMGLFYCDHWWSLSMGVSGFFQRSMFIW